MPSLLASLSTVYGTSSRAVLDLRVVEAAAHEALDREDGVAGVGDGLALGELADQPLAGLGEGDDATGWSDRPRPTR